MPASPSSIRRRICRSTWPSSRFTEALAGSPPWRSPSTTPLSTHHSWYTDISAEAASSDAATSAITARLLSGRSPRSHESNAAW